LALLLSVATASCSSSPASPAGDAGADGGDAATSPTPATGDAAANPAELCPDLDAIVGRCYSSACEQAFAAACAATWAPLFSEPFAQALHQCAATAACVDQADPSTACMAPKVRAATPTAAQQALADTFCQACAQGPSTHDGGLSCVGHVLSAGSTGRMLSTSLLEMSDSFAATIQASNCIASAAQKYPGSYDNCESEFLNCVVAQYPPMPASCSGDAGQ
jgi:hypothetical protein